MVFYYVALMSRSHAFLLERRLKSENVICDLAFMPREIMYDLCNMGVKFPEREYPKAVPIIRRSALPGCKLFKETVGQYDSMFDEVMI